MFICELGHYELGHYTIQNVKQGHSKATVSFLCQFKSFDLLPANSFLGFLFLFPVWLYLVLYNLPEDEVDDGNESVRVEENKCHLQNTVKLQTSCKYNISSYPFTCISFQ